MPKVHHDNVCYYQYRLSNAVAVSRADMIRHRETRMWQKRGQHRSGAQGDEEVHPRSCLESREDDAFMPKPLALLAAAAVGKIAARLNDVHLHALFTAIPSSLRMIVVLEIVQNAALAQTAVSSEALRLLHSFGFDTLDLVFVSVSRAQLCVLLSTRYYVG